MKLIGLDTNIFIYYFQKHPRFGPFTKPIFEHIVSNRTKAITSVITMAELLSIKASQTDIDKLRKLYSEIPNLTTLPVDEGIALEAARIGRSYGFRLPDSIQLATALYVKADIFMTNDRKLKSFRELKVKTLRD